MKSHRTKHHYMSADCQWQVQACLRVESSVNTYKFVLNQITVFEKYMAVTR